MLPPVHFGDLAGNASVFPARAQRLNKIPPVSPAVQAKLTLAETAKVSAPISQVAIENQGSEPATASDVKDSVVSVSHVTDEVDPRNITVPASSKPEISQRDDVPLASPLPIETIVGNIPMQAIPAQVDAAAVVADQVPDFHPNPGSSSLAAEQPQEPAVVGVLPTTTSPANTRQLAIANWNYSLPEQAPVTVANSLAGSANAHPVELALIKSVPPSGRPRANSKSTVADGARTSHFAGQAGKAPISVGTDRISGGGFAAAKPVDDKYRLVGSSIEFQMPVAANGVPAGNLTLHVAPDQEISLQLKELISLLHDRFDPQVLQTLNASQAIHAFVSFGQLRASGIDIRYDAARDRLTLAVDQP